MCNCTYPQQAAADIYNRQAYNPGNQPEYNPYTAFNLNQSAARKHNVEEAFKELQAIRDELAIFFDEFTVLKRELLQRLPSKADASRGRRAK